MYLSRSEGADLAHASLLPRKTLQPRPKNRVLRRHISVGFLVAILVAALGCGIYNFVWHEVNIDDSVCELYTADGIQKLFTIDQGVISDLTYSGARAVDTAWDLVVGQGGRILHSWILCRYIVPTALARLLEQTTLPWPALIRLTFSADSLTTLGSNLKVLFKRPRQLLVMLWLSLAIGYCLCFPVLWGATNGYYQPSVTMEAMPDGTFLNATTSPLLSQCWVIDDPRLADIGRQVIIGRNFSSLPKTVGWKIPPMPVDPAYVEAGENATGIYRTDYLDVAAYVETQFYLRELLTDPYAVNASSIYTGDRIRGFASNQYTGDLWDYQYKFPDEQEIVTICGPSQPGCMLTPRKPGDTDANNYKSQARYPPWAFDSTKTLKASYNSSASSHDNRRDGFTLPYNSTLWLNGKKYDLQAPTLDFTRSCHSNNGLDCTCYNGQPIEYNYLDSAHTQCISSTGGYAWGFSSALLAVAMGLELVWILCCYTVWIRAEMTSVLMKHAWTPTGNVKSALGIAARVETDLGPEAFAYSEKELIKALRTCDEVGHDVRKTEDGDVDVGIFTARSRMRGRRSAKVDSVDEEWQRDTSKESEKRMLQ